MRRKLERVELPEERAAQERAWAVVRRSYADREPVAPERHRLRLAAALAVAVALVAAALSPPGRAVLDDIREAVGVERAQRGLFSLPSQGRLLVASDAGVWVVQPDGSKRLLGDYREASWSPFGRFVVAARRNELAALEPDGDVRWTLSRPGVRSPRWGGTETDTRIAYVAGGGERRAEIRIVAGDGSDDRRLDVALPLPPAWRPNARHVVAYVARSGGRIVLSRADEGRSLRSWLAPPPAGLAWSPDGRRLFAFSPAALRIYDAGGEVVAERRGRYRHAALRPGGSRLADVAAIRTRGDVSELLLGDRVLFRGTGEFREAAWSPDGTWILLTWPTADQWVFVSAVGRKRIVAVADVTRQFRGFPRIQGWCCAR